jgi:hypothetical protein
MGLEKGYKSQNFYAGTDYGFDPSWGSEYNLGLGTGYRVDPGSFALTTDPRSANQLAEVSRKLGTGAKVIEVQGVAPNILDSIPQQHFKEINRLKKLTGVDLTFHARWLSRQVLTRKVEVGILFLDNNLRDRCGMRLRERTLLILTGILLLLFIRAMVCLNR